MITSRPGSIPAVVREAIAFLPQEIRRKLVLAIALAIVLAALEAAAIGGLFSVITVLVDDEAREPGWAGLLLASDREDFLLKGATVVLTLFLVRSGLGFVAARIHARLHAETDASLATTIFERVLRYPYAVHLRRSSSEIMAVLNWSTADVAANVVGATASASVDILVLAALTATLVVLQPLSAVGMTVYFAMVAGIVLFGLAPALRRAADDEYNASVLTHRSMMEGLHGVKAFQMAVATDVVADEHTRHRADLASARQRKVFVSAMSRQTLETAVTLGIGLLAAGLFAFNNSIDALASLALVVAVAFRALPSVSRLLATLNGMRSAAVSLQKIQDELHQPTTHDHRTHQPSPPFCRDITFRGVSYTYGGSHVPALEDVGFCIPIGSSIGIVGRSGSGKTTMVDLLLGLLEPTFGRITVDDVPLDRTNVLGWRGLIGYVPQDVFLLDSSIRDNVVFAGRGACGADDDVWAALDQAQLGAFVRSLPEGLDTMIGERGARISGGQRQRIGIARALYRNPSVLVLDEATSALDLLTEAAIAETIASLDSSFTKIVIAHRLSTVRHCDRIVLLESGRIAAVGTFNELVATAKDFQALAELSEAPRQFSNGA